MKAKIKTIDIQFPLTDKKLIIKYISEVLKDYQQNFIQDDGYHRMEKIIALQTVLSDYIYPNQ